MSALAVEHTIRYHIGARIDDTSFQDATITWPGERAPTRRMSVKDKSVRVTVITPPFATAQMEIGAGARARTVGQVAVQLNTLPNEVEDAFRAADYLVSETSGKGFALKDADGNDLEGDEAGELRFEYGSVARNLPGPVQTLVTAWLPWYYEHSPSLQSKNYHAVDTAEITGVQT